MKDPGLIGRMDPGDIGVMDPGGGLGISDPEVYHI